MSISAEIDFQVPDQKAIILAASRIRNYINQTPVFRSDTFDKRFGCELLFKCENFQKAGAFKSRGAVNAVFSLSEEELKNGVATHSSGNHAQALARAAALRNTKAYIVMPETSPKVKVNAVKHYQGEITFCKPTLKAREESLKKIINETGANEVHPYNNLMIIAGQATCAKEIFEEHDHIDQIVAPVGGGGLLSGTALSTNYFSSKTTVVAAEPEMANDAFKSFYSGTFTPSANPKTIADGLLTSLGSYTFPLIQKYVDRIVTVSEEAIVEAMHLIWERMKIVIEPSAAVPFASIIENKTNHESKKIALILSGGNVDLNKLPWK